MKFCLLVCLLPAFLFANPQGPQVIAGEAHFAQSDSKIVEVRTNDRAIINWVEFSVEQGERTSFIQPNSHSAVLNRVLGNVESQIHGLLNANGKVYLINPHGVLIGKQGVIQTADFVGSTYDVLDEAFLKNQDLLFQGTSTASLINCGTIRATSGDVTLLARTVINEGQIQAAQGEVNLASGLEFVLKPDGEDRVSIILGKVDKSETGIESKGSIQAIAAHLKSDGNIYALAIQQSGLIEANGTVEREGRIYLVAEKGVNKVAGNLIAKNGDNTGGKVYLLGEKVGLVENGAIDVTGDLGGGEVYVGGDGTEITVVERGTDIDASANNSGSGGKVIIWADGAAAFDGTIYAKGGKLAGDGGFVEVSGKSSVCFDGLVNTLAPQGNQGTLLIDPTDVTISVAADMNNAFAGGNYTYTAGTANINNVTLQNNLAVSNVTISTNSVFVAPLGGTITVSAPVNWATASNLSLNANNNIIVEVAATPGIENTSSGGISLSAQNSIFINGSTIFPTLGTSSGALSLSTQAGSIIFQPAAGLQTTLISVTGVLSILSGQDIQLLGGAGAAESVEILGSAGGNFFFAQRDLILMGGGIDSFVQIAAPPNVTSSLQFINVGRNVQVAGGVGNLSFAEIGGAITGNVLSDITFTEVGGNFTVAGGSGVHAFGQVGHTTDTTTGVSVVSGNVSLNIAGNLSISGGTNTRSFALVGMGNVESGLANETLQGNISVSAGAIQITGGTDTMTAAVIGFISSATNSVVSGQTNVHAFGDILIQGGVSGNAVIGYLREATTVTSTVSMPLQVNTTGTLTMNAPGIGKAIIANNVDGAVAPFNVNIHVNNALIGTEGGTAGNVDIYSAGDLIFIADENIHLGSISTTHTVSGQLSLVVDNKFPRRPQIGSGQFIEDFGANISTSGPLRIFTARRQQNTINGLINGVQFIPGPLFVDSATERWGVYFFDPFGGFPFTIFYKDALPTYQNAYGIAISEFFRDLTPYDELIFVRIPFQLCYHFAKYPEGYPKSAVSGYDFVEYEEYSILRQRYRNYNTKYAESL